MGSPFYRIACLHSGNLMFVYEKSFKSKLTSFLLTTLADDFYINILRHLACLLPHRFEGGSQLNPKFCVFLYACNIFSKIADISKTINFSKKSCFIKSFS